jgi:hypothetical protein
MLVKILITILCFLPLGSDMELKEETSPASTKVEDLEDDNGKLYYR